MESVLIIGGSGFIGSQLCRYFVDDGFKTYSMDINIQYFYPLTDKNIYNMNYRHEVLLQGVSYIRGNTMDCNDLRRTILNIRPDYIINLGALPLAQKAVHNSEEAFDSILLSTRNILEVLRDIDFVKNYVHISSSMVYGDFETIPVKVDAKKSPVEIYGSMKLASEFLVKGYAKRHNIPYSIVRPSAVYGPTDNNRRVLQIFIENAMEGKKIIANNPSTNMMDFTYIEDISTGIKCVALSNKSIGEEFNVTRGEGRSLNEAIDIIKSYFPNAEVEIHEDIDTIYPKRGSLDISKAQHLTGYSPRYSLEEGIDKYISFIRKGNSL
jgi:nucleoside-diphosphate-sugar epimerase